MSKLVIRNEAKEDYAAVEHMTREAFWNLYVPGCEEHYLTHILRDHPDFIPELDFVAELDGQVIGNVMYTKARLTDESGRDKHILTFGPLSIHPDFQINSADAQKFDEAFEPKEKKELPCQETFYIMSNSMIHEV